MKLPPLAIGAAVGLAGMALLAPMTGDALGRLSRAREERAELERAAVAPAPASALLPSALAIPARSHDEAVSLLVTRVRALGARSGVLVEDAVPVRDVGALVTVRLRMSGSEGAVLGLIDTLERGAPLVRFARWRVEGRGTTVRFIGDAVASWR